MLAAVNIAILYSASHFIHCASSSQYRNLLLRTPLHTLCQQQLISQSLTQHPAPYFVPAAVNIAILPSAPCYIFCASSSQHCNSLLSIPLHTLCQQQSTLQYSIQHLVLYFVPAAVNTVIFYSAPCSILCASSSSQSTWSSTQHPAPYFMPAAVNIVILHSASCFILCANSSQHCNLTLSTLLHISYFVSAAVNQCNFLLSILLYTLCQQ